jgi:Uma2 family endonuclease
MLHLVKERLTTDEYYQLPEYAEHDLIQLIDGEVIIGMPPIPRHQAIVIEIIFFLKTYSQEKKGQVYTAPIDVYLDEHNSFEPDVLYLTPETNCKVEEKRLVGAPDLVVEVLSPSTAKYDRDEKQRTYERHGVREYWIVDPVHELVEVRVWQEGVFDYQGAYGIEDSFQSKTLAETVSVRPLFAVG